MPVVKRVADYDKANPNKSTREAGEALGVGNATVHRARQQGVSPETPDERPTIENPPKGNLWDDQDDREDADDNVEKRVIGVDKNTVIDARKKAGGENSPPETPDERPTIDNPPKGCVMA